MEPTGAGSLNIVDTACDVEVRLWARSQQGEAFDLVCARACALPDLVWLGPTLAVARHFPPDAVFFQLTDGVYAPRDVVEGIVALMAQAEAEAAQDLVDEEADGPSVVGRAYRITRSSSRDRRLTPWFLLGWRDFHCHVVGCCATVQSALREAHPPPTPILTPSSQYSMLDLARPAAGTAAEGSWLREPRGRMVAPGRGLARTLDMTALEGVVAAWRDGAVARGQRDAERNKSRGVVQRVVGRLAVVEEMLGVVRSTERLRESLTACKLATLRAKGEAGVLKGRLEMRARALKRAAETLEESKARIEGQRREFEGYRAEQRNLFSALCVQRAELFSGLQRIFPIERVESGAHSLLGMRLVYSSLVRPGGAAGDDEVTATSLGFVVQLVQCMASYMATSLRYPLVGRGSRSFVLCSSLPSNGEAFLGASVPRATGQFNSFPLYPKGTDFKHFQFAVYLLNKNIEQMLVDFDVPVKSSQHALFNLKLLLSVTPGLGANLGEFADPVLVQALSLSRAKLRKTICQ